MSRAQPWIALGASVLFGVGLVVSGMTQTEKVLAFLDPFGAFDPSLAFVMIGAIGVHSLAYLWKRKHSSPLFAEQFAVPTGRDIDAKLIGGAALFGAGWGLSGYCPGPAVVSLPGGGVGTLAFVGAMLAGTYATAKLEAYVARHRHEAPPPTAAGHMTEAQQ